MNKPTVYIPTMNRRGNLEKIVPRWLDIGFRVVLVVEPSEYQKHVAFRDGHTGSDSRWWNVYVVKVNRQGRGVGFARAFCVTHAEIHGMPSIIMSDDDMRPSVGSNYHALLAAAADPRALGVGAVRRIHDHFTGGAVSRNSGVIMCPGGWGMQMFGLNVATALRLGNFDPLLHSYGEDGELARQGIAHGIPWRVHCDVWCEAIGVRYDPGGIGTRYADRAARTRGEVECLTIIHDRWPAYTNAPDRPLRVAWQKMLNDYIPDWRKRSAIHGGAL